MQGTPILEDDSSSRFQRQVAAGEGFSAKQAAIQQWAAAAAASETDSEALELDLFSASQEDEMNINNTGFEDPSRAAVKKKKPPPTRRKRPLPPRRKRPPPPKKRPPPLKRSPPPLKSLSPPNSPPPAPSDPNLPQGKGKYGEVLGLAWKFYAAQRSGEIPNNYPVPWVSTSMLTDAVTGGWYDAGDTLKLNFPLATSASFLAWGLIEFEGAYAATGHLDTARSELRVAIDYLAACHISPRQYVGQISEPEVDHVYWGRPSQYPIDMLPRQTYIWDENTCQADLLGSVSAALAAASIVYRSTDPSYADAMVVKAKELWEWGTQSEGIYNSAYPEATLSYPSVNWRDDMCWGAAWLYRATQDCAYLDAALKYWMLEPYSADVYASWDSVWGPAAALLMGLADSGVAVPGIEIYRVWFNQAFLAAWLNPTGLWNIAITPKGMAYPAWSK